MTCGVDDYQKYDNDFSVGTESVVMVTVSSVSPQGETDKSPVLQFIAHRYVLMGYH